jgi:hypothetical protein
MKAKEFMLIFREHSDRDTSASPEDMRRVMNSWMSWMADIASQNKLSDKGNRLSTKNDKVVKTGNISIDGPYAEIKESINGYIIVKTIGMDEAVVIAAGCPVLLTGGS